MATKKDGAKPKTRPASSEIKESPTTDELVRKATPTGQKEKADFPIVGIGASAGGLDALQELFTSMPSDTGMGFVVVTHLDPSRTSIMPELLKRYTAMPVHQATDVLPVKPDNVYVIPQNKSMGILKDNLLLFEPSEPHGLRLPIDFFLRSLAQDKGAVAIGIILSGSGTDGTLGVRAIGAETGLTIVQEPSSAKYDGMPRSAIETGVIDFVLRPSEMPPQLVLFARHLTKKRSIDRPEATTKLLNNLEKIFVLLRQHTRHDFSQYKPATLNRRIDRRMAINRIDNVANYVSFLEQHPEEAQALFKDILIGVTSFFRDREAFIALKSHVKHFISQRSSTSPMRVWVPACATGEEAYSITMIVRECLAELNQDIDVQVFATDIDEEAIARARTGIYPIGIAADVSQEHLRHFFTKTGNRYIVKRSIRETMVFAAQDIIRDPPFSRVDLICCRNLLIYLNNVLQAKLVPLLHYSLNKGGILFLGSAETLGKSTNLFSILDKKWKVYQRREVILPDNQQMTFAPIASMADRIDRQRSDTVEPFNITEIVNKALLHRYTPACVVVDQEYNVLYVHGQTSKYLELPTGPLKMNILDMAREGLMAELASALRKVFLKNEEISCPNLKVKQDGNLQSFDLKVVPIVDLATKQKLCMVMFQTVTSAEPEAPTETKHGRSTRSNKLIAQLEQELASTRETLYTTIEEMETTTEELKSANEELQSTNEELQSTNEEMETSREELQSVNEELMTVNAEHQGQIDELSTLSDDLKNLLNCTEIATIFLDMNLRIRRFTPATTTIFNIIESDIGRPIQHLTSQLLYDKLDEDLNQVCDSLVPKFIEVQTRDARSYTLCITPYRTVANVIQGLVLTMVDITEVKKAAQEVAAAKAAQEVAQSIVNTVREPLVVLDADLVIISANDVFHNMFQVTKNETEKRLIYDIGNRQWDIPKLRELLENILPENTFFNDFVVDHSFPAIGRRVLLLNARKIQVVKGQKPMILLAMEDVTENMQPKKVGLKG